MLFSGVLVWHAVLAAAAVPLARVLDRRVLWVGALAPGSVVLWLALRAGGLSDGVAWSVPWVPGLGLDVAFRADALSALMLALVGGVGVLVFVYASAYMEPGGGAGRLTAALIVFAGAMAGLVTADNLLLLYVFWELTSLASYVLIATHDESEEALRAARHALLVTTAGGLAMLAGFVLLAQAGGTWSLAVLLAAPPAGGTVGPALVLVLVGVFSKSAQVPLHGWLPRAMTAPTPVSAYLHSATMVNAGVYLLARLAPSFAPVSGWFTPVVVLVGLVTLVHAASEALRRRDLKRLLAYATVSQLGLMVALLGPGMPELTLAALVVLAAHALYKAALFMTAGVFDHELGTRDLHELSGAAWRLPTTGLIVVVTGASMAGLPPLLGYVAKEAGIDALLHADLGILGAVALVLFVVGAALTVAYTGRLLLPLLGRDAGGRGRPEATGVPEVAPALLIGPALLAVGSLGLGLRPSVLDGWLDSVLGGLHAATEPVHLSLWHGLTPALGLSALAILLGAGVVAARRGRAERGGLLGGAASSAAVLDGLLRGVGTLARRVTATVQHGSLPVYLATIAATAVLAPTVVAATGVWDPALPTLRSSPLQIAVAGGLTVAGGALVMVRRRMAAVLLLGVVGLGMTVLFFLQGAPDLALTQLLIEVLTLILFILVLGHLPENFRRSRWRLGQGLRVVISVLVGTFVAGGVLVTGAVEHPPPISREHLARALPEAGGANVVNTILVDFRALDTLGEITVLTVAALGVASLVAARLHGRSPTPVRHPLGDVNRSVVLSTGLRPVLPLAVLVGGYLLLIGHDAPGGGFVGGLVVSAALMLRYVEAGPAAAGRDLPLRPTLLLGTGLSVAAGVAVGGWLWGPTVLATGKLSLPVPVLGTLEVGSYALFDVAVFLVVIGFVLMVLRTLGEEPARDRSGEVAEEPEPAR